MQLEGATELELEIDALIRRIEASFPGSEIATTIVDVLSRAGTRLQELRGRAEQEGDSRGPARD